MFFSAFLRLFFALLLHIVHNRGKIDSEMQSGRGRVSVVPSVGSGSGRLHGGFIAPIDSSQKNEVCAWLGCALGWGVRLVGVCAWLRYALG